MKEVKLILACDKNGLIGNNGKIPWRLPEDFKHFKNSTCGNVVMMGRKTWDSLPRKPLTGRINFIISRNMMVDPFAYEMPSVDMFASVESAFSHWQHFYSETMHLFVIGGGQIYKESLNKLPVSEILMTMVYGDLYTGDAFFDMKYLKNWNKEIIQNNKEFEIQRWRLTP